MGYDPKAYEKAEKARVREKISCPCCGALHTKRSWHHKFCTDSCKNEYWNNAPSRIGRSRFMAGIDPVKDDPSRDMSWDAHKFE